MNEKYELTEEFKEIKTLRGKIKVYRIRALRAFADVKKGDLGGFVETRQNLSNMGTLEEFAERVEKEHGENIFGKEYKLLIELAKIHFDKIMKQGD